MHLTRARGGNDDLVDDLASWGVDADEIERIVAEQNTDADFEVDDDNWPAVVLFLRCQTQWKFSGMGQRVGLDYSALDVVARLSGETMTPELFGQIQVLELTTINESNRRANGKPLS